MQVVRSGAYFAPVDSTGAPIGEERKYFHRIDAEVTDIMKSDIEQFEYTVTLASPFIYGVSVDATTEVDLYLTGIEAANIIPQIVEGIDSESEVPVFSLSVDRDCTTIEVELYRKKNGCRYRDRITPPERMGKRQIRKIAKYAKNVLTIRKKALYKK